MHRNLVAGVLEALEWSFGKDVYIDKVLEQLFRRNRKWGKRDRAFVAEHSYTIVRHWRLLWHLMGTEPVTKRKQLWKLFQVYAKWKELPIPNWEVFENHELPAFPPLDSLPLEIKESFPDWLSELASTEIGSAWTSIAHELNGDSALVIRANTLKISRKELQVKLSDLGLESLELSWNQEGLILHKRVATTSLDLFKNGFFEVQDGGSQSIAPLLQVEQGMTVIDACAGAGGKALHTATLMKDHGRIVCMDVESRKLSELERRAERQGFKSIETRSISPGSIDEFISTADRLLLDVPCSGTGVIKRKPDTKWKLKPEYLENVIQTQASILRNYSRMLKSGGLMVYATCSILPSENEKQVENFIGENEAFQLLEQHSLSPQFGSDGYYMALLKKE